MPESKYGKHGKKAKVKITELLKSLEPGAKSVSRRASS